MGLKLHQELMQAYYCVASVNLLSATYRIVTVYIVIRVKHKVVLERFHHMHYMSCLKHEDKVSFRHMTYCQHTWTVKLVTLVFSGL